MATRPPNEFTIICESLLRNDSTILNFSTTLFNGYRANRQQFCQAVRHNTTLNSILIYPSHFRTHDAVGSLIIDFTEVQPLLYFIERNPSLTSVGLRCPGPLTNHDARLVQEIINVMIKNPSIRSFDSECPIPFNALTQLLSSNRRLRRLVFPVDDENASRQAIEAAARSIASHPTLDEIGLSTSTSAMALSPFLLSLQSHPTIRLEIKLFRYMALDTSTLPALFGISARLCKLSLERMTVDAHTWTAISDGLRASPHITHLALTMCAFHQDATALLCGTNAPLPNNALQQHIQRLDLSRCVFSYRLDQLAIARDLAKVVRGSRIRHFTWDNVTLQEQYLTPFFEHLSNSDESSVDGGGNNAAHARDPPLLLHTIELTRMEPTVFESVSAYLSNTVRLCRLNIDILPQQFEDATIAVPNEFLASLRRNGSLHSVHIKSDRPGQGAASPTKRVKRYIRACLKRNRALPKVLSTLSKTKKSDAVVGTDTSNTTTPKTIRLPTLCQSAMQTPQMAPNNVLIGLLASVEALVPSKRERDGKRILAQTRPLGEAL